MKWLDQTKECRGCGEEKQMREFYEHPQMGDGHLNFCKECVLERVREHRAKNIDRIRAYDRARGWRPGPREKIAARRAVRDAIARGDLKVKPCERCSYGVGVQAHHEDYSKPLDVTWLCRRCHGERHREINEERRRAAS